MAAAASEEEEEEDGGWVALQTRKSFGFGGFK